MDTCRDISIQDKGYAAVVYVLDSRNNKTTTWKLLNCNYVVPVVFP